MDRYLFTESSTTCNPVKSDTDRQLFSYLPTSSFLPHICRSPPGRGDADQAAAAGGRWRWPPVSGPPPTPPGSWWSPFRVSCGTAARLSLQSWAPTVRRVHALSRSRMTPSLHPSPRLHPTRASTSKTSPCSRNDWWRGCSRRPFSPVWYIRKWNLTLSRLKTPRLRLWLLFNKHRLSRVASCASQWEAEGQTLPTDLKVHVDSVTANNRSTVSPKRNADPGPLLAVWRKQLDGHGAA